MGTTTKIVIVFLLVAITIVALGSWGASLPNEPSPSPSPTPEPTPEWHTYGIYKINPEVYTSGEFSIPEHAEKIKLTFEVTYTTTVPTYILEVALLSDGETLWGEHGTFEKKTQAFEIEGITGDFQMTVRITLGRATLTVEWYG